MVPFACSCWFYCSRSVAADVLQTAHLMLNCPELATTTLPFDQLVVLVAAMVHDYMVIYSMPAVNPFLSLSSVPLDVFLVSCCYSVPCLAISCPPLASFYPLGSLCFPSLFSLLHDSLPCSIQVSPPSSSFRRTTH